MRSVWKWSAIAVAFLSIWVSLLKLDLSKGQRIFVEFLPVYAVILLGCYGIAMLVWGLLVFPDCPEEAKLLQADIAEAHAYLAKHGISTSAK